ncbi:2-hydroxyacid dehydrogenase [Cohnella algarum]|uniref:2-hydroxyacid dehydrogenase n=1 Tax=Cohnella algarum TaxID=2044859 RepID=UPI0019688802|nr:2-hydroxyacid dehydrogenase [Cohnella algarum]MBN2981662.1 2-hydroxyacid dehydrogenase [Cohnella algarum]
MEKKPKIVVVGDELLSPEFLAESFLPFASAGWEVVPFRFGPPTLHELDELLLVLERDGPDAVQAPEGLEPLLSDAELLVVHMCPVGASLLERNPQLLAVGVLRGGYENVDAAAAEALGIPVVHTLGRTSEAVSDFAVGLMLAEMRNIARCHAQIRAGGWPKEFPNSGRIPEMRELAVGIAGFGEIGRLVAKKLGGFGCRVLAHDPYVPEAAIRGAGAEPASWEALLAESDALTLHTRHSAGSPPLLGADELARMKPGAYLVNTARAGLVDMEALAAALRDGRLAGAALDVFDAEPLPPGHPLLALENVTLTSHIAFDTEAFYKRSPILWREGMNRLLAGSDRRVWINQTALAGERLAMLERLWMPSAAAK